MIFSLAHEAWISIGTSKLRTFLAMLGIIIGVGSVVLMMAVGMGSSRAVETSISQLGSNLLIVTAGNSSNKGLRSNSMSMLTVQDVTAMATLPSVLDAAPASFPRSFQAAAGKLNWNATVTGTTGSYFSINNWSFAEGDAFTGDDTRLSRRVAVVGSTVADKLFPGEAGITGRIVRINGAAFTVVGVLQGKGAGLGGMDQDNAIYIPITTAKTALWGRDFISSMVQIVFVQAVSADSMDDVNDEVQDLLRQRHRLHETEGDNFSIRNMSSIQQVAADTSQALSLLLGAVASISLVVGGIGIMNIMLVIVSERTREIGIRKAIGATENQILIQFLLEAVIIACVGSFAGLVCGFSGGFIAETWFSLPVEYSLWSVGLALGVALGVGVAAGLYPAWKAAKLQPIEALRTVN